MTVEKRPGLTGTYDKRDFEAGPSIYSDEDFLGKILNATGLKDFTGKASVGDFMSGPGKVGLALRERLPKYHYFFLDLASSQLGRIPSGRDILRIRGDVRLIPCGEGTLDAVMCRYAVKDLTKSDQLIALEEIERILKPQRVFVIADMVSPTVEVKDWLNCQHALKQELGGRDPRLEGKCHIPTEQEWLEMLQIVGFQAQAFAHYVSKVDTQAWVRGRQVSSEQLASLNHMILTAPPKVRDQFKIRSETHPQWVGKEKLAIEELRMEGASLRVEIEYPTIIIRAIKKQ